MADETAATGAPASGEGLRRLRRDVERGIVGGVAAGLAEYFNVDVTLVRVILALLVVFTFFTGLLAYLVMWLVIPPKAR